MRPTLVEMSLEVPQRRTPATRIVVGYGALRTLAQLERGPCVLLVTDAHVVAAGWADRAQAVVESAGGRVAERTVLRPGEQRKTVDAVSDLWAAWSNVGAGRDALVIAVGGGVVTDVAGFAAATFQRGIAWVAVPTTLLAMADASLGGKTGVNTGSGKNLAGTIHHPREVVADLDALATLADDAWVDGWAEIVKAGAIGDVHLFEQLELRGAELAARTDPDVADLLVRSMRVKTSVVAADELEGGRREILNFGHTVGHALEHATSHSLSHGRAVAIGMTCEASFAADRGLLPASMAHRIAQACERLGLPSMAPAGVSRETLAMALGADKKRRSGRLRIALPSDLGRHAAQPGVEVNTDELLAWVIP